MPNACLPSDPYALAKLAAVAILERFDIPKVDVAFVLGSGWSAAADDLGELIGSCELAELPGCAPPTVVGHGGELRIVSTSRGKIGAIFTGRTHLYEGFGVDQVVHGVRSAVAAGPDERVRWTQPSMAARLDRADPRLHQLDWHLTTDGGPLHRHVDAVLGATR